jgi:hypothetical protein
MGAAALPGDMPRTGPPGSELTILNRSAPKAENCRARFQEDGSRWLPRMESGGHTGAEILVNATSVAMDCARRTAPGQLFSAPGLTECDIVYNPPQTELLRRPGPAGCRTVDALACCRAGACLLNSGRAVRAGGGNGSGGVRRQLGRYDIRYLH